MWWCSTPVGGLHHFTTTGPRHYHQQGFEEEGSEMAKSMNKKLREMGLLSGDGTCGAKTRSGSPCKKPPLEGSVRCRLHGGASPQVLAKAKERLLLAQDDAVSVLIRIMFDPKSPVGERRQAAVALMDRGGLSSKAELTVEIAPWIGVLEGVVAEVGDDMQLTRQHDYSGRQELPSALTGEVGIPRTIEVGANGQAIPVPGAQQLPDPLVPTDDWVNGDDAEPAHRRTRAARIVRD